MLHYCLHVFTGILHSNLIDHKRKRKTSISGQKIRVHFKNFDTYLPHHVLTHFLYSLFSSIKKLTKEYLSRVSRSNEVATRISPVDSSIRNWFSSLPPTIAYRTKSPSGSLASVLMTVANLAASSLICAWYKNWEKTGPSKFGWGVTRTSMTPWLDFPPESETSTVRA